MNAAILMEKEREGWAEIHGEQAVDVPRLNVGEQLRPLRAKPGWPLRF